MRRKVTLRSSQGLRFVCVLDVPAVRKPLPAVIVCHGFKGNKDAVWLAAIAKALVARGIAVLRVDFPNNPKPNESAGTFANLTFGQEMRDLKLAFTWLKRQDWVDFDRIGLVGHSLGGKLVLHFASQQRIAAVVDLAGVIDDLFYRKRLAQLVREQGKEIVRRRVVMIERRDGTTMPLRLNFFRDLARWKTEPRIPKITAPTLIVHGTDDRSVPVTDSRLAMKLLRSKKRLVLLPGFPHNYKTPQQASRVAKLSADWLAQHLL